MPGHSTPAPCHFLGKDQPFPQPGRDLPEGTRPDGRAPMSGAGLTGSGEPGPFSRKASRRSGA